MLCYSRIKENLNYHCNDDDDEEEEEEKEEEEMVMVMVVVGDVKINSKTHQPFYSYLNLARESALSKRST